MKIFCIITCLLLFTSSQQIGHAQQPTATEPTEESAEGFIELGMPLEEAFTKITFSVRWLSGEGSDEVIFEGKGVTRYPNRIELIQEFEEYGRTYYDNYTLLTRHAVEGNRYIFVPLAQWGGGSGVFWDLNVIDKKTLRTVDEIGLGDRASVRGVVLADADSDTVSITSIRREVIKGKPAHDPKKAITKHFRMIEGILREVKNPLKPLPLDMMFIPAGEFEMGSNDKDAEDDEKPRHTVYLDAFYIDRYEVTNVQYKKFVDANRQWQKDRISEKYHDGDYLKHWDGNDYPPNKGNHPVVYVNWYAAMAYAQWQGKRLPTEAEWEKAARGNRFGREYAWGDSLDFNKANYGEYIGDTTPVGTYDMNGYGLYDMTGNAWEWCLDEYDADFYAISPSRNPLAGGTVNTILSDFENVKSVRVLRGGSWVSDAKFIRVSDRTRFTPKITNEARGFRCVRGVTPKTSQNPNVIFELTEGITFSDGIEVKYIAQADIEDFRDLPIGELRLVRGKREEIYVRSCREYESALERGYHWDGYARAFTWFRQVCGLLNSLQTATIPQQSFISQPRLGVADLELIPSSFFAWEWNSDLEDELGDLEATYQSKVKDGVLTVRETNQNSLGIAEMIEGGQLLGTTQYLTEVVRADFNGDGIEDILLFETVYPGLMGYGWILILTRKSIDGKFEVIELHNP